MKPSSIQLERLLTLLERVGNLTQASLRAAGQPHALQPVPLLALSYLSRANHYSNTPAALADYLGLSRAAVSQSVAILEARGLVRRSQDMTDRRVRHLELTKAGAEIVTEVLPPPEWQKLLRQQPAALDRLTTHLDGLLRGLQASSVGSAFDVCHTCRHFVRETKSQFRCGLTGEPLPVEQTVRICREHA